MKKTSLIVLITLCIFVLVSCQGIEQNKSDFSSLQVGQKNVPFGKFTWNVLDIQDDKALLITEDIVELQGFHDKSEAIDWIGSHLRWYLNWKYIYTEFTEKEIYQMVEVVNSTEDNIWTGASGGGNSKDRIFILSVEEAMKYFAEGKALPTENPSGIINVDDEFNERRIVKFNDKPNSWWLRSPGHSSKYTMMIDSEGKIRETDVYEPLGLRLAVWINIK